MVCRGVNTPHENWSCPLPLATPIKIMTLKPPPHRLAPPSLTDMTTMTRHLT